MDAIFSIETIKAIFETVAIFGGGAWIVTRMIRAAYPLRSNDLDLYREEK